MRTTLKLEEDAYLAAMGLAKRLRISLGDAVSLLIREAGSPSKIRSTYPTQGRYALAPVRDEVITVEHVRELMEREGI